MPVNILTTVMPVHHLCVSSGHRTCTTHKRPPRREGPSAYKPTPVLPRGNQASTEIPPVCHLRDWQLPPLATLEGTANTSVHPEPTGQDHLTTSACHPTGIGSTSSTHLSADTRTPPTRDWRSMSTTRQDHLCRGAVILYPAPLSHPSTLPFLLVLSLMSP